MKLNVVRIFSSGSGGTIGQVRVAGQVPGCKAQARAKRERAPGRLCRVDEAVPGGLTLNPGYAWWVVRPDCGHVPRQRRRARWAKRADAWARVAPRARAGREKHHD